MRPPSVKAAAKESTAGLKSVFVHPSSAMPNFHNEFRGTLATNKNQYKPQKTTDHRNHNEQIGANTSQETLDCQSHKMFSTPPHMPKPPRITWGPWPERGHLRTEVVLWLHPSCPTRDLTADPLSRSGSESGRALRPRPPRARGVSAAWRPNCTSASFSKGCPHHRRRPRLPAPEP